MPQGNYNYDAGYIMNSDKTSVDDPMGSNELTREGLQFDTRTAQDVLTQDAPKQQSKPTVEGSLFAMAEQRDY
jgi:hypothetical protein